jgi:hypothetical protein
MRPTILNASKPPDDHRAATEVPRTSGHPRDWRVGVCLDDGTEVVREEIAITFGKSL